MGIVSVSDKIIPPPENIDLNSIQDLILAMPMFEPKQFIMPFFAHAIGTLFGSLVTALIATPEKKYLAYGIGIFFLLGGIYMVSILPSPVWFNLTDLLLAYLPMSWVGVKISDKIHVSKS
jgi:hypothetical protein